MPRISSLDSMGINASGLKAKAYRVSPVGCLGFVQYAQSAIGSSSTLFPLVDANLFFK